MDAERRSPLDWKFAAAGFALLVVGVGVVTERPLVALGAAFLLLLPFSLVYPFARFAGEANPREGRR
jgi:hypothetical protein